MFNLKTVDICKKKVFKNFKKTAEYQKIDIKNFQRLFE